MTEPTKKQEALIKTMVDEGENLTDAINVVCPNLPVTESKRLYNKHTLSKTNNYYTTQNLEFD